jgi:adenylate cyclase class IV
MKITSFNPVILTKKPEEAIALFEALGFERRHQKSGETENDDQAMAFATVRMKDANGFHIDICTANSDRIERDLTVIRMNVDDFDEAAELLKKNGFRESKVVPSNYTSSSKYAFFVSPSGFIIDLIKHIKKEDA